MYTYHCHNKNNYPYHCHNTEHVHVPLSQYRTCTRTTVTIKTITLTTVPIQNMYTYHCHNKNIYPYQCHNTNMYTYRCHNTKHVHVLPGDGPHITSSVPTAVLKHGDSPRYRNKPLMCFLLYEMQKFICVLFTRNIPLCVLPILAKRSLLSVLQFRYRQSYDKHRISRHSWALCS